MPGTIGTSSDQTIQVIPITANLPQQATPQLIDSSSSLAPVSFGEDDIMILSEAAINTLPCAIFSKLPRIEEEKVKQFNRELYLYCLRKGINPKDWLFDEFGLVMCGVGIAATHWENYQTHYGKKKVSGATGDKTFDEVQELKRKQDEEDKKKIVQEVIK